jgi:S1-C subfamily serine protease
VSPLTPELEVLKARAIRSLDGITPDQVVSAWRRVVGPRPEEMSADALAAKEALQTGETPTPSQLQALEKVIRLLRPAPLAQRGEIGAIEHEAEASFPEWEAFRGLVRPYLRAVGRIDGKEFRGGNYVRSSLATGFAVGPHAVLTNWHVVDQLTAGSGVLNPDQAQIRFAEEFGPTQSVVAHFSRVLASDPVDDLALLTTSERLDQDPYALTPIGSPRDSPHSGTPVAAVGYPMADSRAPDYIVGLFDNKYGVERVSPGVIIRTFPNAFMNDCSMLKGSSGSPLFDMVDGAFIGVHRGGLYLASNTAISGETLSSFLVEHLT